jgi:polyferredoxin
MKRKALRALACCIAVVLGLTFGQVLKASAIHDPHQRPEDYRAAKVRKKKNRKRRAISYVCPMHSDIRSNSHGKCPKCLMDLVAGKPEAKVAQR